MTLPPILTPTLQLTLISTAWMLLWMQTNLPAHLFRLLKTLAPGLPWTPGGGEARYRDEWFTWINVHLPAYKTGGFWAELLSCQYCLGVHTAVWSSLLIYLAPPALTQFLTAVSTALIFQHLILRDRHA